MLYQRMGINVVTTQLTDFSGYPQNLVGEHRPLPDRPVLPMRPTADCVSVVAAELSCFPDSHIR